MTREINIPSEAWTLVTITSCSFQADANLQVAEKDTSPIDWEDPKKVCIKSKIYEYYNTDGKGLWAISAEPAIITIDDSSTISETAGGYLRSVSSFSGDALLTTTYLDDYIVRGNIFTIGISQDLTQDTPIYFTSEILGVPSIKALLLLPILINPTEGYVELNIYEDTDYTGGATIVPTNRNRGSSITNEVSINVGATGADKGTLLSLSNVFGVAGTNQSAGGGQSSTSNAIVLDLNKRYLYELTASETGLVGITAEFGEI